MPAFIAAGAAALYAGKEYLGSRGKKKARRKKAQRLKRAISATEAIQGYGLNQQEALARQATGQELAGFDVAKREASRLGRGAKQSALDREGQLGARASQNLASRGLGSTTIGANLSRGIASDTNRQLSSIDEGMAGMFGDLALGRAGVEAQGTQRLAGIAGQRANMQSQLSQMGLLGGQQLGDFTIGDWSQDNIAQNLVGGAQYGLGVYSGMGGGGGGMGGGMGGMGGMNEEFMRYLYDMQQNGSGHTLLQGPYQADGRY